MEKKLRIAIVGDFPIGKLYDRYEERKCFYAAWLKNLSDLLQDVDDFDIHWIVIDKDIEEKETIRRGNQIFHLIPGSRLTLGLYTGYIYNRYLAARCIKEIQPDIVHGWGTERFYGLVAKDFKGVSLLSVQGLLHAYSQRAKISNFELKQKWYEKGVLKGVDYITTESTWAKERVQELVPEANITLWEYAPEKVFFNLTRKLTPTPTCLCAGTNTAVKDLPTAIRAFSKPDLSHITLYLAGVEPGSISGLPPNIIPLGRLSREEMADYISKTWCLVHPSVADSSPNIVKEARAAGLPAVVTTECGGKQYIDHTKSGFIITPGNADALAEAVLTMTKSADTALRMGAHQHEDCRKKLSFETMKEGIIQIYRNIARNTK